MGKAAANLEFQSPLICKSGEIVISQDTNLLATLGSCVGVVLFERSRGLYALNHYMLPDPSSSSRNSELGELEFGSFSIPYLLQKIEEQVDTKPQISAWLLGGANQFGSNSEVGQKNIQVAERILSEIQIPVVGRHIGGNFGRRIEVNPKSRKISVWLLGSPHSRPVPNKIFAIL